MQDIPAPQPPTTVPPRGPLSQLALWSLILSILSWVACSILAAIPAIICGHMALGRIKQDPSLEGRGLALAGLIVSYINIAMSCIMTVLLVVLFAALAPNAAGGGFNP